MDDIVHHSKESIYAITEHVKQKKKGASDSQHNLTHNWVLILYREGIHHKITKMYSKENT